MRTTNGISTLDTCLPECCHRDDRIPKCSRYRGEFRVQDRLLGVVHDRGEDNDGHSQREEKEAELAGTTLQRVTQYSQALTVTGEFEDTKNTKYTQSNKCAANFAFVWHE